MTNKEELLTVEETSILLKVSKSRIRYEVFLKRIPFIKIGRSIRFRLDDLNNWIGLNSKLPEGFKKGEV